MIKNEHEAYVVNTSHSTMKKLNWPLIKNNVTISDRLRLCYFLMTNARYTNGPQVKKFEKEWAAWVGSRHALMTNSGSSANLVMLSAVKEMYNLKDGDEVLVPACTWSTNISPVLQLGFKPIFCDINLDNFSFDLEHLQQIRRAHPNIKIVFVTHLLGYSADSEIYQQMFPNAILLDDVCESHGCTTPTGERRGATSTGSTFSFYFGHHITTIEGGMICTNNSELYDLMRIKRSHGMSREAVDANKYNQLAPDIDPQFLFVTDGYNVRSTELNAVLGLRQLLRLDSIIERRRENFVKFAKIINQYPTKFFPVSIPDTNSNYSFPLVARSPKIIHQTKKLFSDHGIDHRPLVGGNLLKQPFLKHYDFTVTKAQYNVDLINDQGFYIGNNQFVTDKDLEALDNIIKTL